MMGARSWFAAGSMLAALAAFSPEAAAQNGAAKVRLGEAGGWSQTASLTAMGGSLWSIEADGTLYRTSPDGQFVRVSDEGVFSAASRLVGLDGKLYSIEAGSL